MVLYAKGQEAESARVSQELINDYGAQLGYYIGQLMAYRGMPEQLDAIEFYVTPPPQGVKTQHI
jgi:hypothetical protein